ncbi:hypothetical protein NMF94_17655, partial [Clostridioides difficile]|uniref:hypothetical protein n=1 Tax=Clostridioides difficile TaxID=1496 RepID=UPI0020C4A13F
LTNKCLIITKKINFYSKNTHKYFQTPSLKKTADEIYASSAIFSFNKYDFILLKPKFRFLCFL